MLKRENFLLIFLVILGVLSRTIFHVAPNVEFVTAISIVSGYFFYKKSIFVPFFIMLISDLLIGNSLIFIFTWSAFFISPIFGKLLKQIKLKTDLANMIGMSFSSVAFVLFFFLWTNFGVVLVTNMYEKNLAGLIKSYEMALPFLRNQILGNLVIAPVLFFLCKTFLNTNLFQNKQFQEKLD